ncbi:MAG: glycosyltransferase [Patescibacteria group bacterium]|nr:glycosyltransferase [Patescibacteria group bacterium]
MDQLPKITVVTASFNSQDYIRRAIDSVQSQAYPNVEHIIMDGGSTDGTLEILKSYGNKIKWFSGPDRGIYDALNKGFKQAAGSVFTWLDSDNFYLSENVLSAVARAFSQDSNLDLVVTNGKVVYPDLDLEEKVRPKIPGYLELLNRGNRFMPECMFYKKELYFRSGGLNLNLRLLSDYELWLKFFRLRPKVQKLEMESAAYVVRPDALLRKSPVRAWRETFIIGKMYKRSPAVRLKFRFAFLWALARFYLGRAVKKNSVLTGIYKRYRNWRHN